VPSRPNDTTTTQLRNDSRRNSSTCRSGRQHRAYAYVEERTASTRSNRCGGGREEEQGGGGTIGRYGRELSDSEWGPLTRAGAPVRDLAPIARAEVRPGKSWSRTGLGASVRLMICGVWPKIPAYAMGRKLGPRTNTMRHEV